MYRTTQPKWIAAALSLAPLATLAACTAGNAPEAREGRDTDGHDTDGRDTDGEEPRPSDTLPDGYELTALATGLDFPTAVAFCEGERTLYVSEAGIAGLEPRIVAIRETGQVRDLLTASDLGEGMLLGPLTDITYDHDRLWIAHRQIGANGWMVGAISMLDPKDPVQSFRTVVTDLPAAGDHSVGDIALARDGLLYFSIGSATNSGVVGPDNELVTMWLAQAPTFHDYPAQDIRVSGVAYETDNPLTTATGDTAVTSPFSAFGSGPLAAEQDVRAPTPDTPIDGMIAGNAAVYRMDPDAADPLASLEMVAWGLRNAFGLAFDPNRAHQLYITNNGADIRGVAGETSTPPVDDAFVLLEPRPIANDYDDLFVVDVDKCGAFFGWPDYVHHEDELTPLPVTDPMFCSPEEIDLDIPCPQFTMDERTRANLVVGAATAQFELHSSANKLDVSNSETFGFAGDLFVAETGSFVPITGATTFVGYKVVVVDGETHEVRDFLSAGTTQEDIFAREELNKPIDVKFKDDALVIVDFGLFEPGIGLQEPGTGKLWVVRRTDELEPAE